MSKKTLWPKTLCLSLLKTSKILWNWEKIKSLKKWHSQKNIGATRVSKNRIEQILFWRGIEFRLELATQWFFFAKWALRWNKVKGFVEKEAGTGMTKLPLNILYCSFQRLNRERQRQRISKVTLLSVHECHRAILAKKSVILLHVRPIRRRHFANSQSQCSNRRVNLR